MPLRFPVFQMGAFALALLESSSFGSPEAEKEQIQTVEIRVEEWGDAREDWLVPYLSEMSKGREDGLAFLLRDGEKCWKFRMKRGPIRNSVSIDVPHLIPGLAGILVNREHLTKAQFRDWLKTYREILEVVDEKPIVYLDPDTNCSFTDCVEYLKALHAAGIRNIHIERVEWEFEKSPAKPAIVRY